MRKLITDEKISANRIAKLQDPFIIRHHGRHYVRFGPDLPFDLDNVTRYLAARSNADEWTMSDFTDATQRCNPKSKLLTLGTTTCDYD